MLGFMNLQLLSYSKNDSGALWKEKKRKEQAILMPSNFVLFLFPGYLAKAKADLTKNPGKAQINRPTLLRSLFTLGLLCKQFDFDSDVKPKNEVSIS